MKVGDKVRMKTNELHKEYPKFYPEKTAVGTIKQIGIYDAFVQWPKGSTSSDDKWYTGYKNLEVVVNA